MAKYIPGKNYIGFEEIATDLNVVGTATFPNLTFSGSSSDTYVEKLSGDLYILNSTDDGDILFLGDAGESPFATTTYFALDGGAVKTLFYKNTEHQDNVKAEFGAGDDLEIYHNGTDSFINNDTGDLYIKNSTNDKDIVLQSDDGSGGVTSYIQLDGSDLSTKILTQKLIIANLPTSDPGVDGQVWNNSNVLNVSSG